MTKITAHAGCEGTPKGTRENIETALRCGADAVEVDLRLLNGEVYLSHDALREEALETYLTLRQALELIGPSGAEINCDIKEAVALPAAFRILKNMGMERRAFFTGETGAAAKDPGLRCFRNVECPLLSGCEETLAEEEVRRLIAGYRSQRDPSLAGFNIEYGLLTAETMALFSAQGVPLSCWLVNDGLAIRQLLEAGVDYLTTDCVRSAAALRARKMEAAGLPRP
ncbi:MAG: glycerophosphodiester phosphodiesterase [Oscillibacter sp.]|nr:glycerophosphodiester phosphodiesterase [Oscillibacter sp.]